VAELRDGRVYISPRFSVSFQRAEWVRTPRPDPPHNLGALPVHRVDDYRDLVPGDWQAMSGVFLPLLPEEAIWLGFSASSEQPSAVQIELARVNAVSGMPSTPLLAEQPQNYLVCPPQLHWDGIYRNGSIQPFTAEELWLSPGVFKTLRIIAYGPLSGRHFPASTARTTGPQPLHASIPRSAPPGSSAPLPDPYGVHTWDQKSGSALAAYFLPPEEYQRITGQPPPPPRQRKDVFTRYYLP
jgi:hypothetical protein